MKEEGRDGGREEGRVRTFYALCVCWLVPSGGRMGGRADGRSGL